MHRVGNTDGEAEAEEPLGETEGVKVVVAAEEGAGDCSPEQRGGGEWEIGQVGQREQHGGDADSSVLARKKAREARHEVVVQQELLIEGPQDVSSDVLEVAFVERMQGADLFCREGAGEREEQSGGKNPEGAGEATTAEAQVVEAGAAN